VLLVSSFQFHISYYLLAPYFHSSDLTMHVLVYYLRSITMLFFHPISLCCCFITSTSSSLNLLRSHMFTFLRDFILMFCCHHREFIIIGDFNIHLDIPWSCLVFLLSTSLSMSIFLHTTEITFSTLPFHRLTLLSHHLSPPLSALRSTSHHQSSRLS